MKRFFLFFLSISFFLTSSAAPIDSTTAKQMAISFFNDGTSSSKNISVEKVELATSFSNLHIFNLKETPGFVILAADDCAHPVLGYSTESNFDAATVPPTVIDWLNGYELQMEAALAHPVFDANIAQEWTKLREGRSTLSRGTAVVAPLVTATWGQSSPYNTACPTNTLVGCVAVAMGQVMHYWKYPEHGTGSHSYTYGGITHSVNFASATYNWEAMPDVLTSTNTNLATMLYHCGVGVEMEYGSSVSNAYMITSAAHPYSAESALKNFFGYSSEAHGELRSQYTDFQWIAMMKEDLDAGRPLIYNGFNQNYTGGHCFVCDGYAENNYFHVNWGQRGSYDGYFLISAMNPANQNFSYNQGAIFGLCPQTLVGIEEPDVADISVSPNPTTGLVSILFSNDLQNTKDLRYKLFDISGKCLIDERLENNEVNVANFVKGVYFLQILADGKNIFSQKIIKQ